MAKRRLTIVLFALCLTAAAAQTKDGPAGVAGVWEGESKCTVPASPCHDEHVVYVIKADGSNAGHYSVDAYKIVAGERDYMGTLDCSYPAEPGLMRCIGRHPDDLWRFTVAGDHMTGTLTLGAEKQLYRRIAVQRAKTP